MKINVTTSSILSDFLALSQQNGGQSTIQYDNNMLSNNYKFSFGIVLKYHIVAHSHSNDELGIHMTVGLLKIDDCN